MKSITIGINSKNILAGGAILLIVFAFFLAGMFYAPGKSEAESQNKVNKNPIQNSAPQPSSGGGGCGV